MFRQIVEASARDEEGLDRDVGLGVARIDLHDLTPRGLGSRKRTTRALGPREALQNHAQLLAALPGPRQLGEMLERVDADVLPARRLGGAFDGTPARGSRLLGRGLQERVSGSGGIAALVADARELGPAQRPLRTWHVRSRELAEDDVVTTTGRDERVVQLARNLRPLLGGSDLGGAFEHLHRACGFALRDRTPRHRAQSLGPAERAHALRETLGQERVAVLAHRFVSLDDERIVVGLLLRCADEHLGAPLAIAELLRDRADETEEGMP
ncbi:MAG: hypothetical protein K0S65_6525, partial [Labilithrix sp.]|nr:hypothetical protein [Labilithrix sp.]